MIWEEEELLGKGRKEWTCSTLTRRERERERQRHKYNTFVADFTRGSVFIWREECERWRNEFESESHEHKSWISSTFSSKKWLNGIWLQVPSSSCLLLPLLPLHLRLPGLLLLHLLLLTLWVNLKEGVKRKREKSKKVCSASTVIFVCPRDEKPHHLCSLEKRKSEIFDSLCTERI